ncbi:hypothetical protein D3C73_1465350 [compost metagenome]
MDSSAAIAAGLEAKLSATPRATSVSAAPSRPRSTVQNQRAIRLWSLREKGWL